MEIIQKKICLEDSRSRVKGFLPYIPYDGIDGEDNWGGFMKDLNGYTFECNGWNGDDGIIRSCEMMRRYNVILNLLRNGTKLEKRKKQNNCGNTDGKYIEKRRYINISTEIDMLWDYDNVYPASSFIQKGYEYIGPVTATDEFIILIDDYDIYSKYGGLAYIKEVNDIIYNGKADAYATSIPYIDVDIMLTQNMHDVGLLTDYIEEGRLTEEIASGFTYEQIGGISFDSETLLTASGATFDDYTVESRLGTLRVPKYYKADHEMLPGLYQMFEGYEEEGAYFRFWYFEEPSKADGIIAYKDIVFDDGTKRTDKVSESSEEVPYPKKTKESGYYSYFGVNGASDTEKVVGESVEEEIEGRHAIVTPWSSVTHCDKYEWWEAYGPKNGNDLNIAEDAPSEECKCLDVYRVTTIFETAVAQLPETGNANGDFYWFLVKYDNKEGTPMTIPYIVGYPFNYFRKEDGKYVADFITEIIKDEDTITFKYVLGATCTIDGENASYEEGGIEYEETYFYYPNSTMEVYIDGVDVKDFYYEKIDFEFSQQEVYSEDFNLYRNANISNITAFTTGDIWREGYTFENSGYTINAPVFKEDYLMGASFGYKTSIDVEINRGNAAAFERHFILSECNTMQDLENYRNSFFNL